MDNTTKGKVLNGLKWTSIETFATQLLQFFISILIARRLVPEDYGILGMLAIFIAFSQAFQDCGIGSALIQKKDADDTDFSTAFIFNIGVASGCYLILFFCAPLIASFYRQPLLIPVTRVYAITLIIGAACAVQGTRLVVGLDFKTNSKLSIISVIVSGALGIAMAYTDFGVWALVWPQIGANLVYMFLLWKATKWRPRMVFSRRSFSALFGFGSKHLASGLINSLYSNLSTLIIGRVYNAGDLGLFTRAKGFVSLPTTTLTSVVMRVNYPVLAKLQDDNEKLLSAYSSILRAPMFLLYPVLFGMAALSYPMVLVLLGEKWIGCVPMLIILAAGSLWKPLTTINLNLLYVKGRTDLVLKLEFIKKPIAFLMLFSAIPFGILGMCVSVALYDFIAFIFNCYYTGKILRYGFWKQLQELLPIMSYSLIMTLSVLAVTYFISSPLLQLIIGVPAGIISYIVIARSVKDKTYQTISNTIADKISILNFLRISQKI